PPGTPVHIGERKSETTRIRLMHYTTAQITEREITSIENCAALDSRDGGGRATPGAVAEKRNLSVSKTTPAATEQRVALVIGNANYRTAPLRNPANDAKAVADKLQGLGFKVTLKLDQDQKGMADAIRAFGNQLKAGGAGLFYYAGHGMQVKGRNFLIPVDADIQNEDEVPYRSIDANEVLSKMETARNRLNLMILDACRNNPFSRKFRSGNQGLAQMDAPSGTLVAFATAPGSVASDGSGKNGLYTQHLLASLGQPGVPVEQVFKRVRVGVMKDTRNAQVPWESSSLVGDFYFKPGTATLTTADPAAIELAYWESIKGSTSADDYKSYLKKYPNGQFADLAKRRVLNPPKPSTTSVASIAPTSATKPESVPGGVAGKVWKEPTTGMEFVWIPKGCFQMGSPISERGRNDNEHPHQVCIEGYWLAKYEVTNAQYRQFKPSHDSGQFEGNSVNGDTQPVVNVSWNDAVAFAEWLSAKTGKTFELPTEAEWEYAARAGTQTARHFGDDDGSLCRHANVTDQTAATSALFDKNWMPFSSCDDGYKVSAPVGRFAPNSFGLHDMLGNVSEWTASPYDKAYAGGEKRAATTAEDGPRVTRGGAWFGHPGHVRSAARIGTTPDIRLMFIGLRLARNP
ncbi:MAG: SUMF1/EgtB/PvdO family nonheme iron enzyme, partial [Betaproteobacteria bacterium]|nr:SUMF1/EgtB/PvdO family nonheme iron enzyme [Betaproteobacteria bacterium]